MTSSPYRPWIVRRSTAVILLAAFASAVLVLSPDLSSVRASSLFGVIRSPGDAAFIASHRGDRKVAPENTLPAFESAIRAGARFIETDVQLTSDGIPVLMHDRTVDRTTNGTGRVSELELSELERLDAGSWFSSEFVGTRIPTLEQLLSRLGEQAATAQPVRALIELKGFWSAEEAGIVTAMIQQFELSGLVVLMSFDPVTLDNARIADESIPRAILIKELPSDPVGYAELYGAIAVITSADAIAADRWAVDRIHRSGMAVLVYTLNSKSSWNQAISLGVDGIITDRPSPLMNWMADR